MLKIKYDFYVFIKLEINLIGYLGLKTIDEPVFFDEDFDSVTSVSPKLTSAPPTSSFTIASGPALKKIYRRNKKSHKFYYIPILRFFGISYKIKYSLTICTSAFSIAIIIHLNRNEFKTSSSQCGLLFLFICN